MVFNQHKQLDSVASLRWKAPASAQYAFLAASPAHWHLGKWAVSFILNQCLDNSYANSAYILYSNHDS